MDFQRILLNFYQLNLNIQVKHHQAKASEKNYTFLIYTNLILIILMIILITVRIQQTKKTIIPRHTNCFLILKIR
jgi:hypothetical protein